MATKRQKKTIVTGVTRDQAEEAFAKYAYSDSEEQRLLAEIELETVRLREHYQLELGTLKKDKEDAFEILEAFAREQKDELFSKKKSLEMVHGVIGFRTGTPKLKTLKGFTWASALTLVEEFLPGYLRKTVEIAKDKLLADRDGDYIVEAPSGDHSGTIVEPLSKRMAKCGLVVAQDETFYVEPKKEEVEG